MQVSDIATLVRAFWVGTKPLRTLIGRMGFASRIKKRSKVVSILLVILFVALFAYFMAILGFTYWGYQVLGLLIDKPYLSLFLASIIGCVAMLLFSVTSVGNILYTASDVSFLAPLPVSWKSLATSRLVILYLLYAPLYWVVTLPAVVVSALTLGLNPTIAAATLIHLVLGPLAALILPVAINHIITRFTSRRRSSAMRGIFAVLFTLFVIAFMMLSTRFLDKDSSALAYDYQAMVVTVAPLLAKLEHYLPLGKTHALLFFNLGRGMSFVAATLAAAGLLVWAITASYPETFSRLHSGRGVVRQRSRNAVLRQESIHRALIRREYVVLTSQSPFIVEVVGELLIPLILLIVWAATGVIGEMEQLLEQILSFALAPQIVYLVLLFMANLNLISSTSVSRQGRHFVLDRLHPVTAERYVESKLLFHLILAGSSNAIFLVIASLLLGFAPLHLVWMIPLSLITIAAVALFQLAIDYRNPNEEWTLAQHAMKSNPNGLFGMLVALAAVLLSTAFLILLPIVGLPPWLATTALCPVLLLGLWLGWRTATGQASLALSR